MRGSLAEQLARREENYARIARAAQSRLASSFLPKGTNRAKVDCQPLAAQGAVQNNLKARLVPNPNHNDNAHPAIFVRHKRRLAKLDLSPYQDHLIMAAKATQALVGQSGHVEEHMNLMKPPANPFPPSIPAHDRAMDWKPRPKVERSTLKAYQHAAIRKALVEAAMNGAWDDE